MSDERRELIKALAVCAWPWASRDGVTTKKWIEASISDADALLAALDAEKPIYHEGGKHDSPMQSVTVSYATPGAVVYVDRGIPMPPAEKTCVWTALPSGYVWSTLCGTRNSYKAKYCPMCGGRIVEGT